MRKLLFGEGNESIDGLANFKLIELKLSGIMKMS